MTFREKERDTVSITFGDISDLFRPEQSMQARMTIDASWALIQSHSRE